MASSIIKRPISEKLSSHSKAWLTACLDPFHDNQLDLEGLPDQRSSASVVQLHVQTYTLSAPAVSAGGNWDAKVSYTGFDANVGSIPSIVPVTNGWYAHPFDPAALKTGVPFGALNIRAVASGAAINVGSAVAGETVAALGSFALNSDRGRLIAVGFEVHNTTADIYKQGSVTVAQLPDAAKDSTVVLYKGAGIDAFTAQSDLSARFGSSRSALAAIPTSQTWQAREGVYCIPRMTEVQTEPSAPELGKRTVMALDTADNVPKTIEPIATMIATNGASTATTGAFLGVRPSGFSPIESYFTGLSPETTLTVTFRTFVEYFPGCGSNLLPMATPSPAYDPAALKAYSLIVREAPYAVAVRDNASGDYFRAILKLISQAAPIVASFTGSYAPAVLAAGRMASAAHSIVSRKVDKKGAGKRAMPVQYRS